MRTPFRILGGLLAGFMILLHDGGAAAEGDSAPAGETERDCLLRLLETAEGSTTVEELRTQCGAKQLGAKEEEGGVLRERLFVDEDNILRPWTLMAHRPNYFLLASYNNTPNNKPWRERLEDRDYELDNVEAQFQISVKIPLAVDLFDKKTDIFAAYTARSFWQIYNTDTSSPFRETNYEPEAWLQFRPDWSFWGIKNVVNQIGFNHQSNGRNNPVSRSWNRIFAYLVFEKGNLAFSFKPWYRIPESDENDNNPDITDYMGHLQVMAAYKWGGHTFSVMSRNNVESGFSKGAIEGTWSFPLGGYKYLKGYVQGFSGYGQSLIDYNSHESSIGIGFAVTDWL